MIRGFETESMIPRVGKKWEWRFVQFSFGSRHLFVSFERSNGLSHELKSGIKIFILLFSRIKNKNLGWTKTKKISATKWIRWLAREEATFPGQPILSKREWGKKIITSKCQRHPETLRSPWLGFSALGIPVLKSATCAKLHRWKCSKTKRYDATH